MALPAHFKISGHGFLTFRANPIGDFGRYGTIDFAQDGDAFLEVFIIGDAKRGGGMEQWNPREEIVIQTILHETGDAFSFEQ